MAAAFDARQTFGPKFGANQKLGPLTGIKVAQGCSWIAVFELLFYIICPSEQNNERGLRTHKQAAQETRTQLDSMRVHMRRQEIEFLQQEGPKRSMKSASSRAAAVGEAPPYRNVCFARCFFERRYSTPDGHSARHFRFTWYEGLARWIGHFIHMSRLDVANQRPDLRLGAVFMVQLSEGASTPQAVGDVDATYRVSQVGANGWKRLKTSAVCEVQSSALLILAASNKQFSFECCCGACVVPSLSDFVSVEVLLDRLAAHRAVRAIALAKEVGRIRNSDAPKVWVHPRDRMGSLLAHSSSGGFISLKDYYWRRIAQATDNFFQRQRPARERSQPAFHSRLQHLLGLEMASYVPTRVLAGGDLRAALALD